MAATYLIGLAVLAALVFGLIILTRKGPAEAVRRGGSDSCPHELICPFEDCRHGNEPQARFCGRCGRPLGGDDADSQHKE